MKKTNIILRGLEMGQDFPVYKHGSKYYMKVEGGDFIRFPKEQYKGNMFRVRR